MNILVVNDDGIRSPGLAALVQALSDVASVYVCAPDGQRSAKSHSITLGTDVVAETVEYPGAAGAIRTSGTPADCTKIGLQFFAEAGTPIDMVYSGINLGSNLGQDTLYSGTVGAAAEAAISGCHAVAVSVDSHTATHFAAACHLAVQVIDHIYGKLDPSVVVNINTPDVPADAIKGVRVLPLGCRYYEDRFHPVAEGEMRYALSGEPSSMAAEDRDLDLCALHAGYATVTPLHFDLTHTPTLQKIREWSLSL